MEDFTTKTEQSGSMNVAKDCQLSGQQAHRQHAVASSVLSSVMESEDGSGTRIERKQSCRGKGVLDQLVMRKMHWQLGKAVGEEDPMLPQQWAGMEVVKEDGDRESTASDRKMKTDNLNVGCDKGVLRKGNKRKRTKSSHVLHKERGSRELDDKVVECEGELERGDVIKKSGIVSDAASHGGRVDTVIKEEDIGAEEDTEFGDGEDRSFYEEQEEEVAVVGTCRFQPLNARPTVLKTSGTLFGMMSKIEDRKKHMCRDCGRTFNQLRVLSVHQQMHTIRQNQQRRSENCAEGMSEGSAVSCVDGGGHRGSSVCVQDESGQRAKDPRGKQEFVPNKDVEKDPSARDEKDMTQSRNYLQEVSEQHAKGANHVQVVQRQQKPDSNTSEDSSAIQKGYPCNDCGKVFNLPSFLRRHQIVHTGEKAFPCKFCGKRFGQKATQHRHESTHGRNKPYMCNECGDGFSSSKRLERHAKEKHSAPSQDKSVRPALKIKLKLTKVKLAVNESKSPDEVEMPSSSLIVSTEENGSAALPKPVEDSIVGEAETKEAKFFICPICEKTFSQRSHLNRHSLCHTGEKPFKCKECGKGFTQKSTCLRHERSHTGELPFICTECGNGFAQKSGLQKHRLIHTGERPYSCRFCECRFTQKTTCQRHERVHTGEKPYVCQQCGKAFGQSTSLERHVKTHMKAKPPGEVGNDSPPKSE